MIIFALSLRKTFPLVPASVAQQALRSGACSPGSDSERTVTGETVPCLPLPEAGLVLLSFLADST